MKSRTSFFNGTVFRKNLTRFAPVWGGYILCLLLGMLLIMDRNLDYWFPAHIAELPNFMVLVNLAYALLAAQVLFGDLYNTRMCNALHAMPMRRECWFWTNIASGLFFSVLPTAVFTAVSLPIVAGFSAMVDGWQIPLCWLVSVNLQYLFFFGAAVFSVFCAGSRVGMAVIYGILNFFSYMGYCLVDTVYVPVLHGVILQEDIFRLLCPVVQMAGNELIDCTRHNDFIGYDALGYEQYNVYGTFQLTEGWGYLWVAAAVGIGLALAALWMYRRRRLECAGDMVATRKLEPVFMVLFSMTAAVVFHYIISEIMGFQYDQGYSIFLFIGLAVGWFAGRMLLERQVAVFRRGRNWLGLIVLAAVLGLSMFLNKLDIFGIVTWMPEAEQIESATLGIYRTKTMETPEEIADVLRLHSLALEEMLTQEDITQEHARQDALSQSEGAAVTVVDSKTTTAENTVEYRKYNTYWITYRLKNGRTVERRYYLWVDSEAGEIMNRYMSSIEAVFTDWGIKTPEELMAKADTPTDLYIEGMSVPEEKLTEETVKELFRAVIADCEAGTLNQYSDFHEGYVLDKGERRIKGYSIELFMDEDERYCYFNVYADGENCLEWLESLDILDDVEDHIFNYGYG